MTGLATFAMIGLFDQERADRQRPMAQTVKPLTFKERAQQAYAQNQNKHLWLDNILDSPWWLVLLGAAHFVLAFAVRQGFTQFGTPHGLITLAVGLFFATNKRYPISYTLYMLAYIAGCELMWRQNDFALFWESGKYFSMVIMIAAMLRGEKNFKLSSFAVTYGVMLAPALIFTIFQESDIKSLLSPNATGPVALAVALVFFYQRRFTSAELRRAFFMYIIPAIGVAGIVNWRVANLDIAWTGDSNNEVAGDLSANQVSTSIGAAWYFFALILMLLIDKLPRSKQLLLTAIGAGTIMWLVVQNFFTFSRGGLIGSAVAGFVVVLFVLFIPQKRLLGIMAVAVSVLALSIVFPVLDSTTQGNLSRRYRAEQEELLQLSGRERIIADELTLFSQYPVLGVGLGRGAQERDDLGLYVASSHTEYTRLLAEHGFFGIMINILFVVIAVRSFNQQNSTTARALVASLILWSAFYMFHSATRTVMPAFLIGLSTAYLAVDLDVIKPKPALPKVIPIRIAAFEPTPSRQDG